MGFVGHVRHSGSVLKTWAHLLGETLDPPYPDGESDYHITLAIDHEAETIGLQPGYGTHAFRMSCSASSPKRRGPVIDIYIAPDDTLRFHNQACGFCTLVATLDTDGSLLDPADKNRVLRLQALWPDKSSGLAFPMILEVGLHADLSGGGHTRPLTFPREDNMQIGAESPSTDVVDPRVGILESLMAVKALLQSCESEHAECSHDGTISMPTRVLDLDMLASEDLVRLVESENITQDRYAILSYVWGDKSKLQLVSQDLDQVLRGIVIDQMPRTINHAVQTTHALGIRYLSVDALCIL